MAYKYTNFVEGILDADGGGINDTTTTIAVDFATNSVIPTGLSGSNYMMFVIDPEGAEHAPEVVKATNITGSSNPYTLTVTRNQESSGAKAFDQGRKIVGAVTAAQLTNFATKDGTTFTGDVTVGANTAGHDVKFFGNSDGHYMLWDASADELVLTADAKISFYDAAGDEKIQAASDGHLNIDAGTTLDLTAPTIDLNASTAVTVDSTIIFPATAPSDANKNIEFAEGYAIYSDNTGSGTDNSRLWIDGPDTGEIVLGPRGSTEFLNRLRLRASTTLIEGAIDLNGNLDFAGTLSGSNSVPIVYYSHSGAAGSAQKVNDTPQIFVCTSTPSFGLDDGDIWFDIS